MIGQDKNRELALMVLWQGSNILIQNRTHKTEGGIGFWGGKVKEGEEPLAAAIREAREEVNRKLVDRLVSQGLIRSLIEEIEEGGWLIHAFQAPLPINERVTVNEGEALLMHPHDMWSDGRLMSASRTVLKETGMTPFAGEYPKEGV